MKEDVGLELADEQDGQRARLGRADHAGADGTREVVGEDADGAADVVLGATVSFLLHRRVLPEHAALVDYNARLTAREAYHRAADATWPAAIFQSV